MHFYVFILSSQTFAKNVTKAHGKTEKKWANIAEVHFKVFTNTLKTRMQVKYASNSISNIHRDWPSKGK